MQRITASFYVADSNVFKKQMLGWANQFSICCFMDSHFYKDDYHLFDCLMAIDSMQTCSPQKNILAQLDVFYSGCNDWIFGHLGYDLKNEIESLQSNHINKIDFPDVFLFQPKIVIALNKNVVTISSFEDKAEKLFQYITSFKCQPLNKSSKTKKAQQTLSKGEYLHVISQLQNHIKRGDCYEINFCQEFFIEDVVLDPFTSFLQLVEVSPSPFSCFYKLKNKYLLCASPERYMSKRGEKIFSQPMKGTAARNANADSDTAAKALLLNSKKEKSENVMIVDLVRNDLSRICKKNTVTVNELFGVYSFSQVHQMISTISGELKKNISFSDILRATFPMGSMTGAPKRRVMQLIEQYEKTKRQLFSGSVGYVTPQKDFDFNVVIRSIFYNAKNRYLNYLAGSAVTFYSDAETEYNECLLKLKAIESILL